MYTNFLLLLRSLRACSLEVVLGKVAAKDRGYSPAADGRAAVLRERDTIMIQ